MTDPGLGEITKTMLRKNIKLIIGVAIIVGIIVSCLIYTKPQTVEQRYPYLDFSRCTRIEAYWSTDMSVDHMQVIMTPDDPRFSELIDIIRSKEFRSRIKSIFPKGTRVHRYEEGDFSWELEFCFDELSLPDGSISSGEILSFQDYFGDLTRIVNGEIVFCSVGDEEQWAQAIMEIIAR